MFSGARPCRLPRLVKERLDRGHVPLAAEPEVHGIAVAIDGAVQVNPLAANFHVGLIHTSGAPGHARIETPVFLKYRREALHPTHDRCVGKGSMTGIIQST